MVLDQAVPASLPASFEQLSVFYQPKIDLSNGKICGFEALLRLQPLHPQSHLSPYEYVTQQERSGEIQPLGMWVFTQVARDLSDWRAQGLNIPRVSVNVSQYQLQDDRLVAFLRTLQKDYPAVQGHLEIEITENTLMEHIESCVQRLHEIQALGIKLSIDDFGTGYSSLAYLKQLPINTLKIDKSFIAELVTNPNDAVLVRTMIGMSHELGLRVVAEGAETLAQINLLKRMHCDEVQGFYFSQAMMAARVAEFVHGFQPNAGWLDMPAEKLQSILLVDDESNITAAIKRLLRGERYQVFTANSGQQGLEIMAQHAISVVISDQRMPEMTGVDFLRIVKVLYPETIRVVLSGYTDLRSITDAINEGAIYKFLTKPWEDEVLLMNIREAFQLYDLKMDNQRLTEQVKQTNRELSMLNKDLEHYAIVKMEETRRSINSLQVFHDIIHSIPLPMLGIDDDGLVVMDNPLAVKLFAADGLSMVGRMADEFAALRFDMLRQMTALEECLLSLPPQQGYRVRCQTVSPMADVGKIYFFIPAHLAVPTAGEA